MYERLARKALRMTSERLGSSVTTSFSRSRGMASTSPASRTTAVRYIACPVSMFSSPKKRPARKTPIVRASPAKSSTTSTSPSRMTSKSFLVSPALRRDCARYRACPPAAGGGIHVEGEERRTHSLHGGVPPGEDLVECFVFHDHEEVHVGVVVGHPARAAHDESDDPRVVPQ